jgi:hypothetical protein
LSAAKPPESLRKTGNDPGGIAGNAAARGDHIAMREGFCDPSGIMPSSWCVVPVVSLRSTTGYLL